jgi:signal transduction histidine kinase
MGRRDFSRPILAAIACSVLTIWATAVSAAEPRRVLIIHAFGHAYSPWSDMAGSFRVELLKKSKEPINLYEVSLDTARAQSRQDEAPFVEYIRALLAGRKVDLIVPIGAPSAFFVQRNRQLLFPDTPMLIVGAARRRISDNSLAENDAVVLSDLDLTEYLASILKLLPQTTDVAVVVGNSPVERYWTSELARAFQPFTDRVKIEWFNDLTFDAMLQRAAAMPPTTAILWFLLSEDAAGIPYLEERALDAMREVASVPIFGTGDYQMGRGIVGGALLPTQKLGALGADAALRILNGEKASAVKTPDVVLNSTAYDWRELRRWKISKNQLPPNSIVLFREPTAWEQYRWQIALAIGIILVQTALITVLVREHRRRQFAEVQSRQRMAELAHVNRFSTAGELTASIAHEINQPLGAILTNTETARAILKSPHPDMNELDEILGDILQDDQRATEVIRRMKSLLKKAPFELKQFDLKEIVQETIRFISALTVSRKFELVSVITAEALPVIGDRIQLQQVILNLVVNGIDAMKDTPSENRIISIRTSRAEHFAQLSVLDRGSGIPEDKLKEVFEPFYTSKAEGMGMGLSIARTIVEAHNGQITAKNRDHGGASIRIRLPLVK